MNLAFGEYLQERNQKLERLWQMDQEIRQRHQSGAWRSGVASESAALQAAMDERRALADNLREMDCAPWDYHPQRDNSWLVIQRQRLAG